MSNIKKSTPKKQSSISPKVNRDIESFKNFMERFRTSKGKGEITHTSMATGYPGSFEIDDDNYDDFLKLYTNAIDAGGEFSIVERHKEYSPIIIDIDITYKKEEKERIYTNGLINKIIEFYIEQFAEYFELTSDEQYYAYITEKKHPTIVSVTKPENKFIYELKDGFHIHFPYINTKPDIKYLLRHKMVMAATEEGWFDEFNSTNPIDDIIDKSVIEKNGLMMYGSKKPQGTPYSLTRCYNGEEDIDISDLSFENILCLLSLRSCGDEDITMYKEGYDEESIKDICIEQGIIRKNKEGQSIDQPDKDNVDEVVKARILTKMLSEKRATSFEGWINVGWCLYNINKCLLDSWIDFSRRSSKKYIPGECEKKWNNEFEYRNDGFTIASLIMWAKQDNPTEYADYRFKELKSELNSAIDGSAYNIADYIYKKYSERFVCASIKYNSWYEFQNHRWVKIDSGHTLKNLISSDIYDDFMRLAEECTSNARSEEGADAKDDLNKKSQKILKTALSVRKMARVNEIMDFLKLKFINEKFIESLDENRNLLGFKNGVLDLVTMEFREGRPEDKMTFSTENKYNVNSKDPNIPHVKKIIEDMLPDPEVRNYVIRLLASCLDGNIDQKFHIWTGSGGNGKSILVDLLMKALGNYADTVDITLLTNKRGASNAASPEKVKLKGKRFVVLNEPEGEDSIKVGHMKEMTGGDDINARGLFQDPITFKPQFKLFLLCNKKPSINSNDGGTWRRIRVVPFEMKFVANPSAPNERKIDTALKSKLAAYAETFLMMLIEEYKKYKEEGLFEPKKVKLSTEQYQQASDIVAEYINERLESIPDKPGNERVSFQFILDDYKKWLKLSYNGEKKCQNKNELRTEFIAKLGPPASTRGTFWTTYRFYEENTDHGETMEEEQPVKPKTNKVKMDL